MKLHIPYTLLLLQCLMAGCGQQAVDGGLPVIDVAGGIGTYHQVPVSEFISDVEYIPLETGSEFMIGSTPSAIVTDTHIFIRDIADQCYAFTCEGKLITQIGRQGRGPGEWRDLYGMSIDEEDRIIYLKSYEKIFAYTWDGKFMHDFELPLSTTKGSADRIAFLRDSLFVGHFSNNSGNEPRNWIILDDTGAIIKAFDNHIMVEKDESVSSIFGASQPTVLSGVAYVKENINDTIFTLNRSNELVPAFFFDLGKYAFPHEGYIPGPMVGDLLGKSIQITVNSHPMIVTPDNIFFSTNVGWDLWSALRVPEGISRKVTFEGQERTRNDTGIVLGLYDIASGNTKFLSQDSASRRLGLVNDIDGGLPFWPNSATSSGELVQVLEAYEMKDLLTEEYFAAHPAKDPAAHERLRSLLKNLNEDDNPVIVVAKLRK